VAGDTTEYVLDLAATLPVVISDTEAVYLYGLDILAQQQSERLYYAHDGLGSVRQLLDSTGDIETNYAYDPFGVPLLGGDASNPYQYTGEAWDAEVELLYLRARYYQPEVGRFVTKDPWAGDYDCPGTLNPYAYAGGNPVNRVDPSGLRGSDPLGLRDLQECEYEVSVAPPEPMLFEEFKARFPPDPYRGLPPVPRLRFMSDAMLVYLREAPTAPAAARSARNNPLDIRAMPREIPLLALWNSNLPPYVFYFFIDYLLMDVHRVSNYEPLFLTLLLRWHGRALDEAQQCAYDFMMDKGWSGGDLVEGFGDYFDVVPPSIE